MELGKERERKRVVGTERERDKDREPERGGQKDRYIDREICINDNSAFVCNHSVNRFVFSCKPNSNKDSWNRAF
jgi:hypothetical protein